MMKALWINMELCVAETRIYASCEGIPERFRECSFKNYDISPGRPSDAARRCREYVSGKTDKLGVMLMGTPGTGKTHLGVAILRNMPAVKRSRRTGEINGVPMYSTEIGPARCLFISADNFFNAINDAAYQKLSKEDYIKRLLRYDCLMLDDLRLHNFTPAKQENLFLLVNTAYNELRRIIITTNFGMKDLEKADPSIPSRLSEMCSIVLFKADDYRVRK